MSTALTKDELVGLLCQEAAILVHLASKVEPAMLDYRPTPKQRSTLELLQYLTILGPIHLRAVLANAFDMDHWRNAWTTGENAAKAMDLQQAKDVLAALPALFRDLLASCPDTRLSAEFEMFGMKGSRGSMIVSLVLCHYVAYRMQLFLYLKAGGREELNTMNLWAGRDAR